MAFAKDRAGVRYGRLVAQRAVGKTGSRNILWLCRCDCGEDVVVNSGSLTVGCTKSCGCLQKELLSQKKKTHGLTQDADSLRAIKAFYNARDRCINPTNKRFPQYGGRGITIEWETTEEFFADMGPCPAGFSIERTDFNRGYSKENCKWIPKSDQPKNRTTTKFVTYNGQKITMKEYASEVGVNYDSLKSYSRKYGITPEEAAKSILGKS